MSIGKRLPTRSIPGMVVSAPGPDGMYHSCEVKAAGMTSKDHFLIEFDAKPGDKEPQSWQEFGRTELIGTGFGNMGTVYLKPGQKIFLTHNGREMSGEVIEHRKKIDEVDVVIHTSGGGTLKLMKKIDELRLVESRKSRRLAYQDTDFAMLADMADRKRAASHSIEVPSVLCSGKRRPSSGNDSDSRGSGGGSGTVTENGHNSSGPSWDESTGLAGGCSSNMDCGMGKHGKCGADECTAAFVLVSLSNSPNSPNSMPMRCPHNYLYAWREDGIRGVGAREPDSVNSSESSNCSSSSSSSGGSVHGGSVHDGSWRGTPSPSLSMEGMPNREVPIFPNAYNSHNSGSLSGSPDDDGFTRDDYYDQRLAKKQVGRGKIKRQTKAQLARMAKSSPPRMARSSPPRSTRFPPPLNSQRPTFFECTWPGCHETKSNAFLIEQHVRETHLVHLNPQMVRDRKNRVAEEEFYYRELDMNRMSSLPTMSHRDMARPPHEDPEYQKQLVLEATNQPQYNGAGPSYIIDNNNTSHCNKSSSPKQPVQVGVIRHSGNVIIVGVKPSRKIAKPKKCKPLKRMQSTRKTDGSKRDDKKTVILDVDGTEIVAVKCRKRFGMVERSQWCTQCRWKKACTAWLEQIERIKERNIAEQEAAIRQQTELPGPNDIATKG